MRNFRYQLLRGGRKLACPSCGQRRFVPYVLSEDNETIVNPAWGRCDREQSCGYWMKPDGNPVNVTPVRRKQLPPLRFAPSVLRHSAPLSENSLYTYAVWLVGEAAARQAFARYHIMTAADGGCVFPQIDIDGGVRSGKIIRFKDGHRVKEGLPVRWLHRDREYIRYVSGDELQQCLFGEHLLKDTTKPVAVVESEKTALLLSAIDGSRIWLACGGSCNLQNDAKTAVLQHRDVTLYPDNGMYIKWKQIAARRRWCVNYACLTLTDGMKEGYDILDIYEIKRLHDEI